MSNNNFRAPGWFSTNLRSRPPPTQNQPGRGRRNIYPPDEPEARSDDTNNIIQAPQRSVQFTHTHRERQTSKLTKPEHRHSGIPSGGISSSGNHRDGFAPRRTGDQARPKDKHRSSMIAMPTARLNAHHPETLQSSTRRLSAGFTTSGPPTADPTIACSNITATKMVPRAWPPRVRDRQLPRSHTLSSIPVPTYPDRRQSSPAKSVSTSPTKTPLPRTSTNTSYVTAASHPDSGDENGPPPQVTQPEKKKGMPRQGIPKSRTLGVFSNLTSSFSRSSLVNFGHSDPKRSSHSPTADFPPTPAADPEPTRHIAEQDSRQRESMSYSSASAAQYQNSRHIYGAQSSAYWTGRFVGIQDRLRCQMLLPENLPKLAYIGREGQQDWEFQYPNTTSGLTASATTGCIPTAYQTDQSDGYGSRRNSYQHTLQGGRHQSTGIDQRQQKEEDEGAELDEAEAEAEEETPLDPELLKIRSDRTYCARRAFLHLEAMCADAEAHRSLHAWQQAYAHRFNCEALLPRRSSNGDRGWMGRLLGGGGGGADPDRRAFSFNIDGGIRNRDTSRGYAKGKRGSFAL